MKYSRLSCHHGQENIVFSKQSAYLCVHHGCFADVAGGSGDKVSSWPGFYILGSFSPGFWSEQGEGPRYSHQGAPRFFAEAVGTNRQDWELVRSSGRVSGLSGSGQEDGRPQ